MKENREIVNSVIENLEDTIGLTWSMDKRCKVTRSKLLDCWSIYRKDPDYKFYGYNGASSLATAYKNIFHSIDKNNKQPWKAYILNKYKYKYCPLCTNLLLLENYYLDSMNADNRASACKICKEIKQKKYRDSHKDNKAQYDKAYRMLNKEKIKEHNSNYYKEHKKEYVANAIRYKLSKINRTPKWANIEKIKKIYIKCPKDYHVDHIIPLQGVLVSGLHVENNLQYLTAEENLSKSNKYKVN